MRSRKTSGNWFGSNLRSSNQHLCVAGADSPVTEPRRYIHQELASGRWHTMSLANQIGNVGSEYERTLRGKTRGDVEYFERAQARLVELLELTISDPRLGKPATQ